MTLQEKIQKKAEGYGQLAPAFLEGANFALENQWISVEDDLPCNHEELRKDDCNTKDVWVILLWNDNPKHILIEYRNMDKKVDPLGWYWPNPKYLKVTHWMPIPQLPKEQED